MDFYRLTFLEYHYVAEGYMLKDEADWQRMRLHATLMINLQLEKGKHIEPEELIKLPSDEVKLTKKALPTYEDMMAAAERYRKE